MESHDVGIPCNLCGGTRWVCECQVEDLERRINRTYCAYCGWEISLAAEGVEKKVHEHILNCEQHPLGIEVRRLRAELDSKPDDEWLWRGVDKLYRDYWSEDREYSEALGELMEAWDKMLD